MIRTSATTYWPDGPGPTATTTLDSSIFLYDWESGWDNTKLFNTWYDPKKKYYVVESLVTGSSKHFNTKRSALRYVKRCKDKSDGIKKEEKKYTYMSERKRLAERKRRDAEAKKAKEEEERREREREAAKLAKAKLQAEREARYRKRVLELREQRENDEYLERLGI